MKICVNCNRSRLLKNFPINVDMVSGRHSYCQDCVSKISTAFRKARTLYGTWKQIKQRCTNPNHGGYKYYGAKGIGLCSEWTKFEDFNNAILSSIGHRPKGKTLDRIDGKGDYEAGNVRWSTAKQQVANRSLNQTKPRIHSPQS